MGHSHSSIGNVRTLTCFPVQCSYVLILTILIGSIVRSIIRHGNLAAALKDWWSDDNISSFGFKRIIWHIRRLYNQKGLQQTVSEQVRGIKRNDLIGIHSKINWNQVNLTQRCVHWLRILHCRVKRIVCGYARPIAKRRTIRLHAYVIRKECTYTNHESHYFSPWVTKISRTY